MRRWHWYVGLPLIALFIIINSTADLRAEVKFMRVHGQAAPPYGFVQFCHRHTAECVNTNFQTARFHASPKHLSELDEVNRHVNATVKPATDEEIYNVEEYWTFPTSVGDCEDYVLLKRRMLMDRGWPASALLITVVIDEQGDGHAVLTARTAHGDFILDNQSSNVKQWTSTPYQYVMRQSYVDPRIWVALTPRAIAPSHIISGLRKY